VRFCEQLIASNEEVETSHSFVHPLHDARAEAIRELILGEMAQ